MGTGTDKTQGTQAQPYKLGTLQESALPHLLYSLPYSPIAASLIQGQCIYTVGSDFSDIYLSRNLIYLTEDWGQKVLHIIV